MMKLEQQVEKNTKDIDVLKVDTKEIINRLNILETFIIPELKLISKKLDDLSTATPSIWNKIMYVLLGIGFISFAFIIISFIVY